MFGPGRITADSVLRWYAQHDNPAIQTAPRRLAGVR